LHLVGCGELAFGVTAKVIFCGLLYSTERIGPFKLSQRQDMKKSVHLRSLLTRSSIVIMLLPLNVLGAEQLADIHQKLPLANNKPICSSINSDIRRIRAVIFTHVLVSLGIACRLLSNNRLYEIYGKHGSSCCGGMVPVTPALVVL
jgi:hypothetical protein